MLNSPSNLSFKFGAKFVEIDKKFALTRNMMDALTDRVNAIPTVNIDELNSKITANTENITDLDSTKADTSYVDKHVNALTSRVTTNETDIDSLETNLGALTSGVINNATYITTINKDLNDLTAKVTANEGNITTINDDLEELTSRVDSNESNIDSLETNLNALTTRVTTNESDIEKYGGWIDNLVSSVAYEKQEPFKDFYKHLFDMIYPVGSVYTTVTDTPPPNIYDTSSGKAYATWKLLETGTFLRNYQENTKLGDKGGTPITQLPAHTHTTNVSIDGKLYSASRGSTLDDSHDSKLINCGLFAPKEKKGVDKTTGEIIYHDNVFYSETTVSSISVPINWSTANTTTKDYSRATSSGVSTEVYFPITLKVNKDYATNSTTASNTNVNVIADNALPDNCPPFMYVKMYKRTND